MSLFETDNIKWQYHELIKTLIALSLPAEKQREVYGVGLVGDEMLEDFYSYYVLIKNSLIEREFVTYDSEQLLNQIDLFTDKLSEDKDEDFWDELEKYEEWQELRTMAKNALVSLGMDNYGLKVKHENDVDKKNNIVVQKTTVKLIEKNKVRCPNILYY
ncbi:hypothetical protein ACG2LH_08355 [Zhouia sp. PK063]|uniref:hypothetical protein n=1 Tax=Zhouia sp. PK063 TaxID=3373602 RepID=UPI0037AEFC4F